MCQAVDHGGALSERLMRIGELAERTGLSLPTIRRYDETGLLTASGRTVGNFRLYTEADYEKVMVIRRMKPLGFTLEEMRQLLVVVEGLRHLPEDAVERPSLLAELRTFIAAAVERRRTLERHIRWADEFLVLLRQEDRGTALPSGAEPDQSNAEGSSLGG
jgi:DNA-binding transcriptional MerR regulator